MSLFLLMYQLAYPGTDGTIILRWIFRKWDVGVWNGSSWLRIGTGGRPCECGNETSGSMKCGEFLDWLKTGQLLKEDSAPRNME
jgi:hypothetical protein